MKEESMYFPLFISLQDKKCVVIGGGNIAAGRVETLLKFCGNITVIAPSCCEKMKELMKKHKISYEKRPFQSGDCNEAFLVVAATDNRQVNKMAGEEARENGVMVSVADRKEECTFLFPGIAMDTESGAVIGVCTSGRNHSLAKQIARKCRELLGKVLETTEK